jgi:acyl-CoA hydrolase
MINRRSPHQVGKDIAKGINSGRINFFDKHLSMFPSDLVYVRTKKEFTLLAVKSPTILTLRPRFNLPPSFPLCGPIKEQCG